MAIAVAAVDPATDTYYDVERLLHHVCNMFQRRYGGDYDDLLSIAHEVFMDAYLSWDPSGAPFTNYLPICLYRRLKGVRDKYREEKPGLCDSEGRQIEAVDTQRTFDRADFVAYLSEDAKAVVSLIFDTPEEIMDVYRSKGGEGRNFRSSIKDHLQGVGWSWDRIKQAFDEVRAEYSRL